MFRTGETFWQIWQTRIRLRIQNLIPRLDPQQRHAMELNIPSVLKSSLQKLSCSPWQPSQAGKLHGLIMRYGSSLFDTGRYGDQNLMESEL